MVGVKDVSEAKKWRSEMRVRLASGCQLQKKKKYWRLAEIRQP